MAGATPAERKEWGLTANPRDYRALAFGGQPTIEGVDDAEDYRAVRRAMDVVGMSPVDQNAVYRICAGILHLLNVQFSVPAVFRSLSYCFRPNPALSPAPTRFTGSQPVAQILAVQFACPPSLRDACLFWLAPPPTGPLPHQPADEGRRQRGKRSGHARGPELGLPPTGSVAVGGRCGSAAEEPDSEADTAVHEAPEPRPICQQS